MIVTSIARTPIALRLAFGFFIFPPRTCRGNRRGIFETTDVHSDGAQFSCQSRLFEGTCLECVTYNYGSAVRDHNSAGSGNNRPRPSERSHPRRAGLRPCFGSTRPPQRTLCPRCPGQSLLEELAHILASLALVPNIALRHFIIDADSPQLPEVWPLQTAKQRRRRVAAWRKLWKQTRK